MSLLLLLLLLVVASDGEYYGVQLPGYCERKMKIFPLKAGESNPTSLSHRDLQICTSQLDDV